MTISTRITDIYEDRRGVDAKRTGEPYAFTVSKKIVHDGATSFLAETFRFSDRAVAEAEHNRRSQLA